MSFNVVSAFSHAVDRNGPVTMFPCQDSGHFQGNTSLPLINIVDTPGMLNTKETHLYQGDFFIVKSLLKTCVYSYFYLHS